MAKVVHDFQASLKKGKASELRFSKAHIGLLVPAVGYKFDFVTTFDNSPVELKSDSYDLKKSPNFFFERWSCIDKKKPGGPWQSLANGVKWFVYYYPSHDKFFVFELRLLVAALNVIEKYSKKITVFNRGWSSQGFLVLRNDLAPLMTEHTLKERNKVWTMRK